MQMCLLMNDFYKLIQSEQHWKMMPAASGCSVVSFFIWREGIFPTRNNGIRIGICGALAADLTLTETFLRMGIDELQFLRR